MNWYGGDIHEHSLYSGPKYGNSDDANDTLEEIKAFMQSKGLSFGAASDHHNALNHEAWLALSTPDFVTIQSKEISTTRGHVMALDTPGDVIFDTHLNTDEERREEFKRVCAEIHSRGGVAQLNHPRDRKPPISFPPSYTDIIGIFDMLEVWNGSETMEPGTKNGDAFELWLDLLRKGLYLPANTGSDTHRLKEHMPERLIKTVVYAEHLTREEIIGALKKGHSYMTSGPEVDIQINGKRYGETAVHQGTLNLNIGIRMHSEADTLTVYTDKGKRSFDIDGGTMQLEYSCPAPDATFMVFEVGKSTYHKAITNPIFLRG